MEKITKEEIKEMAKDIAAVVAEDLQGQFKVFGEQLSDVNRKVDGIAEDLKVVRQDVEFLKEDMDYVKSEIVEIKDRFKKVDDKLVKKADKLALADQENRIIKLENAALAEA